VADPAVITAERHVRARLDVDCDARSPLFGCAVLDSAGDYAGPAGGVPLTLILDLDWKRYLDDYVRSLQTPGLGEAGQ
jgi:hypothetical protein